MEYIRFRYADPKWYLNREPRTSPYRRIKVHTLERIPMWHDLNVRNGCPVRYKSGYMAPIRKYRFTSAQEVSNFLHTDGRKGLFRITRFSDWWEVMECIQMRSKKKAFARAAENWFGYIFSWKKNDEIFS